MAVTTKLGRLLPTQTALFVRRTRAFAIVSGNTRSLLETLAARYWQQVCDVQERFRPLIHGFPAVVDTARRMVSGGARTRMPPTRGAAAARTALSHFAAACACRLHTHTYTLTHTKTPKKVRGANTLGIPVVVTEQNPARLGATVPEVSEVLQANTKVVPKTLFSMLVPEVDDFLTRQGAIKQVCCVFFEGVLCAAMMMGILRCVCVLVAANSQAAAPGTHATHTTQTQTTRKPKKGAAVRHRGARVRAADGARPARPRPRGAPLSRRHQQPARGRPRRRPAARDAGKRC